MDGNGQLLSFFPSAVRHTLTTSDGEKASLCVNATSFPPTGVHRFSAACLSDRFPSILPRQIARIHGTTGKRRFPVTLQKRASPPEKRINCATTASFTTGLHRPPLLIFNIHRPVPIPLP